MVLPSPTIGEWNAARERDWSSIHPGPRVVSRWSRRQCKEQSELFWSVPNIDGKAQVPHLFGAAGTDFLNDILYRNYVLDLEDEILEIAAAKYAADWINKFLEQA